ncbi:MAG: DUF896 domain-containing protein [Syntrophomonadaceae bacterium]|nr:DUF896 domain-containing protein [Syntrophomonadaceae bacterium]
MPMNQDLINRINELARIKKEMGLTPEQEQEQKQLYGQYIEYIKGGVRATLDKAKATRTENPSCSCGHPNCEHSH